MGVKLQSSSGGSVEIAAPVTASNYTLTAPAANGTILNDGSALSANKLTGALPAIDGSALTGTGLGVGQTWQNVTASRAVNVTYTNTTGKPISAIVLIGGIGTAGGFTITIGGVAMPSEVYTGATGGRIAATYIIPDGGTYRAAVTGTGYLVGWMELR